MATVASASKRAGSSPGDGQGRTSSKDTEPSTNQINNNKKIPSDAQSKTSQHLTKRIHGAKPNSKSQRARGGRGGGRVTKCTTLFPTLQIRESFFIQESVPRPHSVSSSTQAMIFPSTPGRMSSSLKICGELILAVRTRLAKINGSEKQEFVKL